MDQNTSQNVSKTTASNETVSKAQQDTADNQPAETYTRTEVDGIMADVRKKTEAKLAKKYEGIDVEHYKNLLAKEESEKIAKAKEKSEFEQLLKSTTEKLQSKISTLTAELTKERVDTALINAASTKRAINPEQVARLVRDNVKMLESGEVEIVDHKTGRTRYTDNGEQMDIQGLVAEFLQTNPHFVQAGTPGSGSKSNTALNGVQKVDVAKLDMQNPEHRKIYAQHRKTLGY